MGSINDHVDDEALQEAINNLQGVKHGDVTELKSLANPPKLVHMTCQAVMVALGAPDPDWKLCK